MSDDQPETKKYDEATMRRFGSLWTSNIQSNKTIIKESGTVGKIRNQHKNKTCVIVACGPGLDKNIHLLSDDRVRNGIVIATDKAFKAVLNYCKPEYVLSIDPQAEVGNFFKGTTNDYTTLLTTIVCQPRVFEHWKGRTLFFNQSTSSDNVQEFFREQAKETGVTEEWSLGYIVTNACLMAASWLGCNNAIIIGNDLGYSELKTYANCVRDDPGIINKFNTLETQDISKISRNATRKVRDPWSGKDIYTTDDYILFARTIADFAKHINVVNATESGIFKMNGKTWTFAEAIEKYL